MIIIVGLGNPGKKLEKTRHNLGFRVVDGFAKKNDFPEFKLSRLRQGFGGQAKKFNSLISTGVFNGEKIILAKPQTFMNESGKAIRNLIRNWKLEIRNLIVIHDDLDLLLGEIRIVKNRSSAGHKGVQSIINELGTKDFVRFRIGIKSQKIENRKQKIETFVLRKFNKDEEKNVKEIIKKTIEAIEFSLKEGLEKAMQEFNSPR